MVSRTTNRYLAVIAWPAVYTLGNLLASFIDI
jgi:hypothetical protein